MAKLTLTRQQAREVDRIAIEHYGFTGLVLMENAGRGVVDALLDFDPRLTDDSDRPNFDTTVVILCGKGNNAGDGFVIARHLAIRGVTAKVILLAPPSTLRGDALANYEILQHSNVALVDFSAVSDLPGRLTAEAGSASWIVDAMLGTGAQGEPREPVASAVAWSNSQPARRLAVDMPSGLDCDSGKPSSITLRADLTCTFVAAKCGFFHDAASEYLGTLCVVSIGVPAKLVSDLVLDR